jgi:hypothetical protein
VGGEDGGINLYFVEFEPGKRMLAVVIARSQVFGLWRRALRRGLMAVV